MADVGKNVADYVTMKKRKERLEHKIVSSLFCCVCVSVSESVLESFFKCVHVPVFLA